MYTPVTSVHISHTSASKPSASKAAVKSEPPRPSVVVRPSSSAPTKPCVTTMALAISGFNSFCAFSAMASICGAASPNSLSVRSTFLTSKLSVCTFCSARTAENISEDMRSPIDSNWSFKSLRCRISSWLAKLRNSSSSSFNLGSMFALSSRAFKIASSISIID